MTDFERKLLDVANRNSATSGIIKEKDTGSGLEHEMTCSAALFWPVFCMAPDQTGGHPRQERRTSDLQ